jgi:hypothetical protein
MHNRRVDKKLRKQRNRERESAQRDRKRAHVESYIAPLRAKRQISPQLLTKLLREPPDTIRLVFAKWISSPVFRRDFLPQPFPRSYSKLGAPGARSAGTLESNLRLALAILEQSVVAMNEFVVALDSYSECVLSDQLDRAEQVHSSVVDKYGVSLIKWGR